MSFREDFLEAWRSVKRDFFRDSDYESPEQGTEAAEAVGAEAPSPATAPAETPPSSPLILRRFHQRFFLAGTERIRWV